MSERPEQPRDPVDAIVAQWAEVRPDLDTTAMEVFGRVNRLSRAIGERMDRAYARFGISRGEFDVLATLRRSGEPYALSPRQLSATLMLTTGGMTGRLDKLERAGLLRRSPTRTTAGACGSRSPTGGGNWSTRPSARASPCRRRPCRRPSTPGGPVSWPTCCGSCWPRPRSSRHTEGAGPPARGCLPRTGGPAPSVRPGWAGARRWGARQALASALGRVLMLREVTRCSSLDLSRTMTRPAMTTNSAIGART